MKTKMKLNGRKTLEWEALFYDYDKARVALIIRIDDIVPV